MNVTIYLPVITRAIFSAKKKQLQILDRQRRQKKGGRGLLGKAQRIAASHIGDKLSGQKAQHHFTTFLLSRLQ